MPGARGAPPLSLRPRAERGLSRCPRPSPEAEASFVRLPLPERRNTKACRNPRPVSGHAGIRTAAHHLPGFIAAPAGPAHRGVTGMASRRASRVLAQTFEPWARPGDWARISSQKSEVPFPARSSHAGGWTRLLLANLSAPLPPRKSLVMRKARLAGSHSGCLLLFMWHLWLALITSRAQLPTPRLVKRLK